MNKPTRIGRPPIHGQAMSPTERKQRQREEARRKEAEAEAAAAAAHEKWKAEQREIRHLAGRLIQTNMHSKEMEGFKMLYPKAWAYALTVGGMLERQDDLFRIP